MSEGFGRHEVATPEARRELLARLIEEKAARESVFDLSHGQKALWHLHSRAPESAAYNVAFSAAVRPSLDTQRLRRTLAAVTKRNELPRATFKLADGGPAQRIHPSADIALDEVDALLSEMLENDPQDQGGR